jgi:hypothetical protein
LAQQKHHRVAHVLEQQKSNESDCDHHDDGLEQALKNESKHAAFLSVNSPSWDSV